MSCLVLGGVGDRELHGAVMCDTSLCRLLPPPTQVWSRPCASLSRKDLCPNSGFQKSIKVNRAREQTNFPLDEEEISRDLNKR